jgi:hypothetical protein
MIRGEVPNQLDNPDKHVNRFSNWIRGAFYAGAIVLGVTGVGVASASIAEAAAGFPAATKTAEAAGVIEGTAIFYGAGYLISVIGEQQDARRLQEEQTPVEVNLE